MKLIHEVRAFKTKKELANIVRAQRISERVLGDVLKKLNTGVTELEIANFIEKSFINYKAPILSFPPILCGGLLLLIPFLPVLPDPPTNHQLSTGLSHLAVKSSPGIPLRFDSR